MKTLEIKRLKTKKYLWQLLISLQNDNNDDDWFLDEKTTFKENIDRYLSCEKELRHFREYEFKSYMSDLGKSGFYYLTKRFEKEFDFLMMDLIKEMNK